ncbi:MAG: hypothetical protein WAM91_12680 [Candidatus Acidiferrales bacterium]
MKKHLLVTCALLAFAIPMLAQQFRWVPFKEPDLKFAILFPTDPVRNAPDVKKADDGSVQSTGYLFVSSTQGVYVAIAGRTDYNFTVNAERELIADRDNFVKATDSNLDNSRRYDFQSGDEKLPAMEFAAENSTWFYKGVFVVRENNAYCALFGYVKGQDYSSATAKFLDSFEITK